MAQIACAVCGTVIKGATSTTSTAGMLITTATEPFVYYQGFWFNPSCWDQVSHGISALAALASRFSTVVGTVG